MPPIKPLKRKELIHYFKKMGFEGPYSGGKHQYMLKDDLTVIIPNPHNKEISKHFLLDLLKEAYISVEDWIKL